MNNKLFILLFLLVIFISPSCDRDKSDPKGDEMARFNAWIDVNGLANYKQTSGIYYISETEGIGVTPKDSDVVIYNYVLRNLDDYVYENTYKDTAILYDVYDLYSKTTHYVPKVIQYISNSTKPKGFAEGIGKMKVGGKSRIIVPSSLGYGKNGNGSISGYTSLIWDVELVKIFDGSLTDYENSLINEYITNYPTFNLVNDTVYYKNIWSSGTGSVIKNDSIVKVNYIGRFLDGIIFDTNIKSVAIDSNIYNSNKSYTPLEFTMGSTSQENNVGQKSAPPLKGFQFAVKQMREGDTADFVIPSKYMYGESGTTNIPPYTPLYFRVIVVNVRQP